MKAVMVKIGNLDIGNPREADMIEEAADALAIARGVPFSIVEIAPGWISEWVSIYHCMFHSELDCRSGIEFVVHYTRESCEDAETALCFYKRKGDPWLRVGTEHIVGKCPNKNY